MNPNPDPTAPTPESAAPTAPAMPPVPAPPGAPQQMNTLVEFIRVQRQNVAYILLGLSVAFLVVTIMMAVRSFRPGTAKADDAAAQVDPLDPTKPPEPKVDIADRKRGDYMMGWIGTLFGFLVTAASGVWFLVGLPPPTEEKQRTEARVTLLIVGGLLGFGLLIMGGWYFYHWSDSLEKWLDKGEAKERLWVVIPMLMIAAGAGLVFMSVQPARAEERSNSMLRRLVYGSNFGLSVLLLLVVLIVANVVVSMKVPNKLDTTETGFYSLSQPTQAFLSQLPETVNAYAILPGSNEREVNDIRQFLYSCQDASDGKFHVRFVSPVSNQTELANLQIKYPRISKDSLGVLLTMGEDEKRNVFIPAEDFLDFDQRSGSVKAFAGESRVMRELRFLADNEQRPTIYFTQGNGEMSIGGPGADTLAISQSASMLKSFLEKAYLNVKPLVFSATNASVPDDAAIVVVAEPQTPLSDAAVAAIRKFMTTPRPDGRKGKLIVLAGAVSGPDNKGVVKTGLEGLLAEMNVRLGDKYIYSLPIQQAPSIQLAIAVFAKASEQNPIVQSVANRIRVLPFFLPREVAPLTNPGQYQATPLLVTMAGRETWLESERVVEPERTIRDLLDKPAIAAQKGYTDTPRPVAVVVTEGGTGRAVVYGDSFIFGDRYAEQRGRGASGSPATFDLMAVTIDWLRDRPPLPPDINSKVYKEYQFPDPVGVETNKLIFLPLGFALLLVLGIGAGVWVIRRK